MKPSPILLLCLALLAACGSRGPDLKDLEKLMESYAIAVRWGDLDGAYEFVDPKTRETDPMSAVERERLRQVQVAGYEVKRSGMVDPGRLRQVVEIRLVNRHTQVERIVLDEQVWRWDEPLKRWWLESGLYDPTAAR